MAQHEKLAVALSIGLGSIVGLGLGEAADRITPLQVPEVSTVEETRQRALCAEELGTETTQLGMFPAACEPFRDQLQYTKITKETAELGGKITTQVTYELPGKEAVLDLPIDVDTIHSEYENGLEVRRIMKLIIAIAGGATGYWPGSAMATRLTERKKSSST